MTRTYSSPYRCPLILVSGEACGQQTAVIETREHGARRTRECVRGHRFFTREVFEEAVARVQRVPGK